MQNEVNISLAIYLLDEILKEHFISRLELKLYFNSIKSTKGQNLDRKEYLKIKFKSKDKRSFNFGAIYSTKLFSNRRRSIFEYSGLKFLMVQKLTIKINIIIFE
ncbi:hypothetical protein BpHYR1_004891 [Brachionus plicatilis]|uniref:Uncharacterized protein n=1 Tax=Brachionus plicatilis TaxID=10195 RepID=A0A3M7RQI9_BRAPC|nr:hypothetical protein BpHYR1_004891 [Brachionus plicatilis]